MNAAEARDILRECASNRWYGWKHLCELAIREHVAMPTPETISADNKLVQFYRDLCAQYGVEPLTKIINYAQGKNFATLTRCVRAHRLSNDEEILRKYILEPPLQGWMDHEYGGPGDETDTVWVAWSKFDEEMGWTDDSQSKYPFDMGEISDYCEDVA